MLDALREWIMAIVATGALCGIARAIAPGPGKKAVGAVCGFAMLAAFLSIAGDVDAMGIGMYAARYKDEAESAVRQADERVRSETRFIIEERCEAYILDKAEALGVSLEEVSVTAEWSGEGFWYPVKAKLRGDESSELSRIMEAQLGISRENQTWSAKDGR